MSIEIKSFPASKGESFLIQLKGGKNTNILIDCGYVSTAKLIIEEINQIISRGEKLDLIVLTHIDNDHINGARDVLKYIVDNKVNIGEIWYNDYIKIVGNKYLESKLPQEIEHYIDRLSEIEYKNEPGINKKEQVGFGDAASIIDYLTDDYLYWKWNKSFDNSIFIENNEIKKLKMNDEVNISILGPNKKILDEALAEWEEYFVKYANGEIKVKNKKIAKAFEKYFISLRDVPKKIQKNKCSNDDVDDMLEYNEYDTDVINRSSIAIVIEFNNQKLLFLGDSSPIDIEKTLENYISENSNKFEIVKVPHHGSKNNMSKTIIEAIECEKFLISTNGAKHKHPDAETIAKILYCENKNIYLNYKPKQLIEQFLLMGKDISKNIVFENENITDKRILSICL